MSTAPLCRIDGQAFRSFDRVRRGQIQEWIRSLGLVPEHLQAYMAVTRQEGGQLVLHLSEYILDEQGRITLDYALGTAAARPLTVPIDYVPFFLTQNGAAA